MSTLHRVLTVLLAKNWMPDRLERSGDFALDVKNLQLACIADAAIRTSKTVLHFRRRGGGTYAALPMTNGVPLARRATCGHLHNDLEAALQQIASDASAQKGAPDWSKAPPDATHYNPGNRYFYKVGPNAHARMWGMYSGNPAWIAATHRRNEDLDAAPFIPRPTTDITLTERNFEMSDEQAKALALETRPMKVVMCKFGDTDKEYAYWAPADAKQGDYGVVYANKNIIQSRDMPFAVVQITQGEVLDTSRATKALLGTFNEDFAKHVEARIQHMASVRTKLALKKKAFEEGAFYEMMAKSDPEAAQLLEELKQFQM